MSNLTQNGMSLIEKAFNMLKSQKLNIKQVNNQTDSDVNFVELITIDGNNNEFTFKFKLTSNETDQDDVYNISNPILTQFGLKNDKNSVDMPEDMKIVTDFNDNHGDEIMSVISDYIDLESNNSSTELDEINDLGVTQSIDKLFTSDLKKKYIISADKLLTEKLGENKKNISKEKYIKMIKRLALLMFTKNSEVMNEDEYPDGIGNSFKSKNQIPNKRRRKHLAVKINELNDAVSDENGKKLNIGDVITFSGAEGNFQIGVSYSNRKPFIMPYDIDNRTSDINYKIYLTSLVDVDFNKVLDFSDTQGGFMNEDFSKSPEESLIDNEIDSEESQEFNNIEGGLADEEVPSNFDPEQLSMGLKVEMEHTDDPKIALEIAMDHLMETSDYYTQLEKIESNDDNDESEDTKRDELLGYKPHNVGDYVDDDGNVNKLSEEESTDYEGNVGDKYEDANGEEFTVTNKTNGGVNLRTSDGSKETETKNLSFLKKINESENLYEKRLKIARRTLNKRGLNEGMSKKEATQLLVKHNIK